MSILGEGGCDCWSWDPGQEGDLFLEIYCSIFTIMAEVTFIASSSVYPLSSLSSGRQEISGYSQGYFPPRDSLQVIRDSREGRKYQNSMINLQNLECSSYWDQGRLFWCNLLCFFTSSQLVTDRELKMIKHTK